MTNLIIGDILQIMFGLKPARKEILVVDDEAETLTYLANILKRADYEVISAFTGKDAVALAKKYRPHIIILDIVLPDMDGGEVASILSEDPSTRNIPIVFLTGIIRKSEEYPHLKTGKSYVIAKPVAKEELLKIINQALSS